MCNAALADSKLPPGGIDQFSTSTTSGSLTTNYGML
jgi:hypothetical protein